MNSDVLPARDDLDFYRVVECPCCGGDGVVCVGMANVYEHGCGFSHPEPIEVECGECGGSGSVVTECEPITLDDLDEVSP